MQQTSHTASIALGRGLAAGALMGALLKTDQRVALKYEGNGPMKKLIIEAEYGGIVRGCVGNPSAEAAPMNGRWNVPGILGKAGFLTVSKDIGMGGEPYQGTVQLQTSEIGDDLAFYLTDSEQTPSAIGLGASLDSEKKIKQCGGFLVQVLPGAADDQIETIMRTISDLPPLTDILADKGPEELIQRLFADSPYTILETHELSFHCNCSLEKVTKALRTFSKNELQDMVQQDNGAEVTCEFCRQIYQLSSESLLTMIAEEQTSPASPTPH